MGEERKKWKVVLYSSIGIAIVVLCSALVIKLIIDVWKPPFLHPKQRPVPAQIEQMNAITKGLPSEGVVRFRSVSDEVQNSRFHDWEIPAPVDSVSTCISCHGNMPHIKDVRVRAFLNKHTMHMACQTCHMPRSSNYAWYDINNGDIRASIPLNASLLVSSLKLAPISLGQQNFARPDVMASAAVFRKDAAGMSVSERQRRLSEFHSGKAEKPFACATCHAETTQASIMPFERLGYTPARARQIVGNEAAGMIANYPGEFFLPNFLMGQGDK